MRRSGGDEPEVELFDGARRWWPVWVFGTGLLVVALIAALSGDGVGESATTTPETTMPLLDEGVGGTTQPPSPLSTAPAATASVRTPHLGLTGVLIAWAGTELHRLELTTGEWVQLPPHLVRGDMFSTSLAASPTGFVAVADEGVFSFDLDGVELDRFPRRGSMAQLHTQLGQLWVADGLFEAGLPQIRGLDLDGTCTYQELEVPSMAVVAELELPPQADPRVGPAGFSPDLRYWHDPWGGRSSSAAWDVTSGEVVPSGALEDPEHWPGRGFWSPDSKWLVSFDRGTVRMVELATGRILGVPGPDGVRDTMSIILLYLP